MAGVVLQLVCVTAEQHHRKQPGEVVVIVEHGYAVPHPPLREPSDTPATIAVAAAAVTIVIAILGRMAPNNTNEYFASSALGSHVVSFFLSCSVSIIFFNILQF